MTDYSIKLIVLVCSRGLQTECKRTDMKKENLSRNKTLPEPSASVCAGGYLICNF